MKRLFSALRSLFRRSDPTPKRVYYTGGGWGAHIKWWDFEQFKNINEHKTFRCWGHQPVLPQEGDILVGDFERSTITFEFVKVEPERDPPDMFFADVKPIKQELKETT